MSRSSAEPSRAVLFAWKTHPGNFRPNNEDAVLVRALDDTLGDETPATLELAASASEQGGLSTGGDGCLAIVCDGVGGGAAGEIASSLAAQAFYKRARTEVAALSRDSEAPHSEEAAESGGPRSDESRYQGILMSAVRHAHDMLLRRITEDRALEGMGTTLTAAWIRGASLYLAHVGDSRLYRLRGGQLEQLSKDQSLVGGLRRSGTISEAEARRHPLRNIIDQALGGSVRDVVPEIERFDVEAGDEYLLCSDGLNDALPDGSLRHLLVNNEREEVGVAARLLLQAALDSAGRDNVSLALLRVEPSNAQRWANLFPWFKRLRRSGEASTAGEGS